MHKLFDWAKTSTRGLLLFIDEAEAFLGSRSRTQLSEDMRNVLSALLYETGTQSANYMLVLATNRPGDLDSAITDRVDEAIFFDLPSQLLRRHLVSLYFHDYVLSRATSADRERLLSTKLANKPNGVSKRRDAASSDKDDSGDITDTVKFLQKDATISPVKTSLCSRKQPPAIRVASDVTVELLERVAVETRGFSGRQISKLMLNLQVECLLMLQ